MLETYDHVPESLREQLYAEEEQAVRKVEENPGSACMFVRIIYQNVGAMCCWLYRRRKSRSTETGKPKE